MSFDYLNPLIWGALLLVLWGGFFALGGIDLGIGIIFRSISKTDNERRIMLNIAGPIWESNQVWLILGAGAMFGAWAKVYGVLFTGLYGLIFFTLLSTILRAPAFKFRSKLKSGSWRLLWDITITFASLFTVLGLGLFFGTIISGIPYFVDDEMRMISSATIGTSFSPVPLTCAGLLLALSVCQGSLYSAMKSLGALRNRLLNMAFISSMICMGVWLFCCFYLNKPLFSWWYNYFTPGLILKISFLPFLLQFLSALAILFARPGFSIVLNALCILNFMALYGLIIYPYVVPSSICAKSSLTVWNASASPWALMLLSISVIILLPIVLGYVAWAYWVVRGKVTEETIENEKNSY